jgi:gamma-glutamyltranspeptidase
VSEAVTVPRFGTNHFVGSFRQAPPQLGSLLVNEGVGDTTIRALTQRGHHITVSKGSLWAPSAIRIDRETGRLDAAGDPGAGRHAAAY